MEYLLLIIEFIRVKGFKGLFFNALIPFIFGVLIYREADWDNYKTNTANFHTNIVTVIGILIGFTISTFTLLLTVNHSNIDKAKGTDIKIKIFNKELNLYDEVLIGLAYTILIQGLVLIANFIYPVFIPIASCTGKLLFSINIAFVLHIILILMRSILDFYFILTK